MKRGGINMPLKVNFLNIGEKRIARQRKLLAEKRQKDEIKLQEMVKNAAKNISKNKVKLEISPNNLGEISITDISQTYRGILAYSDSIWAPWSKSFKKY